MNNLTMNKNQFFVTFLLYVICVLICSLPIYGKTSIQVDKHHSLKSIQRNGDIILGGLFSIHNVDEKPIHLDHCGKLSLRDMLRAISMLEAIEAINQDQTILPNITLGYQIVDDCNSLSRVTQATVQFVIDEEEHLMEFNEQYCSEITRKRNLNRVPCVVGAASSSRSQAVANILSSYHIPQISYASTSTIFNDKKTYPYFLRTVPSDLAQARAYADIIIHYKWTYIAVVASSDTYGTSALAAFRKDVINTPICLAVEETISSVNRLTSVQSIVQKLKTASNATVIVLFTQKWDYTALMEEIWRQNVTDRVYLTSESTVDKLFFRPPYGKQLFQGMLVTSDPYQIDITKENISYPVANLSLYQDNLWIQQFFNTNCLQSPPHHRGHALSDLIQFEHLCQSNDTYRQPIPYVDFFLRDVTVVNSITAIVTAIQNMLNCQPGQGLLSNGRCPNITTQTIDQIVTEDLMIYLKNVQFSSILGQFRFSPIGNGPERYTISALNFRNDSFKFQPIALWEADQQTNQVIITPLMDKVHWKYGHSVPSSRCMTDCPPGTRISSYPWSPCCGLCIACGKIGYTNVTNSLSCQPCPLGQVPNANATGCLALPIVFLDFTQPLAIIIIGLSAGGALTTAFFIGVFIKYRRTPVIKSAHFLPSLAQLIAVMMNFGVPLSFMVEPTDGWCIAQIVIFSCCCILLLSLLLVKTYRIVNIFNNVMTNSKIVSQDSIIRANIIQVSIIVGLMGIPIVFMAVWFSVQPPRARYEYTSHAIYHECSMVLSTYTLILVIYVLSLMTACLYLAFRARKLPQNFNEAKFISFTMVTIILVWAAFVPAYAGTNGLYRNVASCLTVISTNAAILCCLFTPKIYIIYLRPERNNQKSVQQSTMDFMVEHSKKTVKIVSSKKIPLDNNNAINAASKDQISKTTYSTDQNQNKTRVQVEETTSQNHHDSTSTVLTYTGQQISESNNITSSNEFNVEEDENATENQ